MSEQGYTDATGTLRTSPESPDSELMPERAIFAKYSREAKIELLKLARAVFIADGSSDSDFRSCPHLRHLLLNLQLRESDFAEVTGNDINLVVLREIPLTVILISLPPVISYEPKDPELRSSSFYHNMKYLGYSQKEIDNELTKMMLLAEHFGMA